MIEVTIDGRTYSVDESRTIMEVAYKHGVYIPAVCHHPDLPPYQNIATVDRVYRGGTAIECEPVATEAVAALEGCGLCVVAVEGMEGISLVRSFLLLASLVEAEGLSVVGALMLLVALVEVMGVERICLIRR